MNFYNAITHYILIIEATLAVEAYNDAARPTELNPVNETKFSVDTVKENATEAYNYVSEEIPGNS